MATIRADTKVDARGIAKLNAEVEKLKKNTDESSKSFTKAERFAQHLSRQVDPVKRHSENYRKLAIAVKDGGLSMEDAARLAAKYDRQLDRAQQTGRKFGDSTIAQFTKIAGSIGLVTSAVGFLKAAFADAEQAANEAASRIVSNLGGIGGLQQLPGGPEAFQQNLGFANAVLRTGATSDVGLAVNVARETVNAGVGGPGRQSLLRILRNQQITAEDAGAFVVAVQRVRGVFQKAGRNISFAEAADKVLATSQGTSATAPATALASAKFGASVTALGFDPDIGLAALRVAESQGENIDRAKQQIAGLFAQIDKRGLSQGTFRKTFESIRQRRDRGEGLFSILGEISAVEGFRLIEQGLPGFEQGLSEIRGARGLFAANESLRKDPTLRAASLAARKKGERIVAQNQISRGELVLDSIREDIRSRTIGDPVGRAGDLAVIGLLDRLGLEGVAARGYLSGAIGPGNFRGDQPQDLEVAAEVIRFLSDIEKNTRAANARQE